MARGFEAKSDIRASNNNRLICKGSLWDWWGNKELRIEEQLEGGADFGLNGEF